MYGEKTSYNKKTGIDEYYVRNVAFYACARVSTGKVYAGYNHRRFCRQKKLAYHLFVSLKKYGYAQGFRILTKEEEMELTKDMMREFIGYNVQTGKVNWKSRDLKWFANSRSMKRWNTSFGGETLGYMPKDEDKKVTVLGNKYSLKQIVELHQS